MKIALIIFAIACIAYYFYQNANNQQTAGLNQEKGLAFFLIQAGSLLIVGILIKVISDTSDSKYD